MATSSVSGKKISKLFILILIIISICSLSVLISSEIFGLNPLSFLRKNQSTQEDINISSTPTFQKVPESEYKNASWKEVSFSEFNGKTLSFYIPIDWEASKYTSVNNRPEIEVFPTHERTTIQNLSPEEQKLRTIVITVLPEKDTFGNLWGRVNLQTDRRYTATRFLRIHKPDDWDAVYSERENEFKEVLYVNPTEDVSYIRSGAKVVDKQNVFNTIVSSISLQ